MKTEEILSKKVGQAGIYEKPVIEIIEMETEGILCASGTTPIEMPGEDW
ncbi:hypothetical protein SAMN05216331_13137 [Porphyromonadaceae bacterium KH3R12]|jgi:hypothetical protein|nr:hypothetical protein [Proteiniphilum saccharofermentans]SEA28292.1 hypothetical protein SAMN05216331_13137 [Porphyromonadaceae bacterium KH3R12]